MWNSRDDDRPRKPAAEPEIIPPGRADPRSRQPDHSREPDRIWAQQRVYIARPGPLGVALGLIGLGAFAAVGIVAFLGLFLILIPVVGVMIAAFILAALLRGPRRL
jgi:hypothetical protein